MNGQGQLIFDEYRKKKKLPSAVDQNPPVNSEEAIEQGHDEALKESVKEQVKETEKFEELVDKSRRVLFKVKSVFPFDLFPNEITIDLNQVSIVLREFFFDTGRRHNIFINNIVDVYVDTNPFFGTLRITERGFIDVNIEIKYLKKEQAKRVRRIIQGLVIAHQQGIDMTKIDNDFLLLQKVEELGRGK